MNRRQMLYEREDVADLAYRRLKTTCDAAGLDLYSHSAPEQITGTGRVYCVLAQGSSGWARDEWHQSVKHPVLVVNIYADHSRDADGHALKENALNRALAVFDFLDPLLDGMTSKDWPEIFGCYRDGEPQRITPVDGFGEVMLHVRYVVSHG